MGSIKLISEFLANKLLLFEQIEIILTDCLFAKTKRSLSSCDSPEFDSTINISSVLGTRPIGTLTTYCASKGGLNQLTATMALELARYNIRVNAIAPGYIETPMNSDFFKSPPGEALINSVPQRRLGQVQDLDGVLLLLASDASNFVTGTVMTVDGGFSIR